MFDNGSMKITGIQVNQVNVDIKNLQNFIEDNLKYSPNKEAYLEMAKILESSDDKSKIKDAAFKLINMAKELGKNIILKGLSTITTEVIQKVLV